MVDTINNDSQTSFESFVKTRVVEVHSESRTSIVTVSTMASGESSSSFDDLIEILSSLSALKSTALVLASTSDHDDFSDKLDHLIERISVVEDELIGIDDNEELSSSTDRLIQLTEIADTLTDICVSAQVQSLLPLLEPFIKTLRRLSSS